MSLTQTYNNMLKRVLDPDMLKQTFAEENYIYEKMKHKKWSGATYEFSLEDGQMGSVQAGSLVDENDINMGKYSLGLITAEKQIFGALKVLEADLSRHTSGKVSYIESILPDKVEAMIKNMRNQFSDQILGAGALALATDVGTVGGLVPVDKPELFTIGQLIEVAGVKTFVRYIDMNTGKLTCVTATGGTTATDLSAVVAGDKVKIYGSGSEAFLSLHDAIFPAALGGVDSLYGLTKVQHPTLQASFRDYRTGGAVDGTITTSNILDKLLNWSYHLKKQGRGDFNEHICSYGVFKEIAKKLESQRRFTVSDKKSGYGFNSVSFIAPEGEIKITAVKRMVDTAIYSINWDAVTMLGQSEFETIKDPEGKRWFPKRASAGYSYITDVKLGGEMLYKPQGLAGILLDASVGA